MLIRRLYCQHLTINRQQSQLGVGQEFQDRGTGQVRSFAAVDISEVIDLTDVSVGVFTQAIQNIATLRADNGGSMSRLRHASDDVALAEDQHDCGQWSDQGCGYRNGEHEPGEVSSTRSGIRIDAGPGQH